MNIIQQALVGSNPCVFLSGGVDSLLTLYFVREQNKEIPAVVFAADWTKEQLKKLENLIFEWDLTAYIYPPSNRYFIDGLSLVDEYSFAGLTIPVVRDVEKGIKCAFTLNTERNAGFNLGWDTVFTGVLASDAHPAIMTPLAKQPVWERAGIKFVSPLHGWTKSAVERAVRSLKIDKYVVEATGEIELCTACMHGKRVFCPLVNKEIEPVSFDGKAMLKEFRKKFEV